LAAFFPADFWQAVRSRGVRRLGIANAAPSKKPPPGYVGMLRVDVPDIIAKQPEGGPRSVRLKVGLLKAKRTAAPEPDLPGGRGPGDSPLWVPRPHQGADRPCPKRRLVERDRPNHPSQSATSSFLSQPGGRSAAPRPPLDCFDPPATTPNPRPRRRPRAVTEEQKRETFLVRLASASLPLTGARSSRHVLDRRPWADDGGRPGRPPCSLSRINIYGPVSSWQRAGAGKLMRRP